MDHKISSSCRWKNAGKWNMIIHVVRKSGITMSETRLFPSEQCDGYFGTKRFDRRIDQTGKKEFIC